MYSDNGTAWECGYAFAKNKLVIVMHCQAKEPNNLMITMGCHANLKGLEDLKNYDFNNLEKINFYGHTPQN